MTTEDGVPLRENAPHTHPPPSQVASSGGWSGVNDLVMYTERFGHVGKVTQKCRQN